MANPRDNFLQNTHMHGKLYNSNNNKGDFLKKLNPSTLISKGKINQRTEH